MKLGSMNTLILRGGLTLVAALMLSTAGFAQGADPVPDDEVIWINPIDVEIPVEDDFVDDNLDDVIIIDDGWVVDDPVEEDPVDGGGDGGWVDEDPVDGGWVDEEPVDDWVDEEPVDDGWTGDEGDAGDPVDEGGGIIVIDDLWLTVDPIDGLPGEVFDCLGCEMQTTAMGGVEVLVPSVPRLATKGRAVSSFGVANRPTSAQYGECVAENPGLAWLCNW